MLHSMSNFVSCNCRSSSATSWYRARGAKVGVFIGRWIVQKVSEIQNSAFIIMNHVHLQDGAGWATIPGETCAGKHAAPANPFMGFYFQQVLAGLNRLINGYKA